MRAYFAVQFDIVQISGVTFLLLSPFLHHGAAGRLMVLCSTLEAETFPTFAFDRISFGIVSPLDDVIAIFLWTPLYLFVQICELLAVPSEIFVCQILLIYQVLHKVGMWNNDITSQLWTLGEYTHGSIINYFAFEVVHPTYCAELMATGKLIWPHIIIIRVKFHIHDVAHIPIILSESLVYVRILLDQGFIIFQPNCDFNLFLFIRQNVLLLHLFLVPVEMSQYRYNFVFVFGTKNVLRLIDSLR